VPWFGKRIAVAALTIALNACAAMQRPVLYPNAHLKDVGNATAQRDIDECLQLAENSGMSKSNNQVVKRGAEGAAVGAAAGSVDTLVGGGNVGAGAVSGPRSVPLPAPCAVRSATMAILFTATSRSAACRIVTTSSGGNNSKADFSPIDLIKMALDLCS
jgi:hypothetical protein